MILFESMLERARKNNVEIDRGRGIANGSLMLVAGMLFARLSLAYAALPGRYVFDTRVRNRDRYHSSC